MTRKRKTAVTLLTALLLYNLCFIWGNSLVNDGGTPTLPPEAPGGGGWLDTILRVGGQLAEFACLGGLSGGWAIALRKAKLHPVLHLLFAGFLTAAIDETLQLLFGQGAGLLDMWLDFAGFAGGLLAALVVRAFLCRSAPEQRTWENVIPFPEDRVSARHPAK